MVTKPNEDTVATRRKRKEGIFKPKQGWLKITKDTTNEYIINHILRVKSLKEGQNLIEG